MNATKPAALMRLGVMAVNSGHDDQGVRYFREALALSPNLVESHFGLGTSLFRMDDFNGSIRAFSDAAVLDAAAVRRTVCGLIENSRPEPLPIDRPQFNREINNLLSQFDEAEDLVHLAAKQLRDGVDETAVLNLERSIRISYPHELAAIALISAYMLLRQKSSEAATRLGEASVLMEVEPALAAALFRG